MTVESLASFALALLVWVMIPGPAVFAIIGRALTTGPASAFRLITGILLGDIFYMTIVLFGLAAMGRVLGEFFIIVRLAGAAYLIFLGIKLWLSNSLPGQEDTRRREKPYTLFLTGFSITLGNPKAILFHLGFLPTFFDLTAVGLADAAVIIGVFIAILGTALGLYAYAAGRARRLFKNRQRMKLMNRVSGSILVGAGIAVAATD